MVPQSHAILTRRLRRVLAPHVAQAAAVPGADRYRKHFPAAAHLWILLRHALSGQDSLRQTHAELDLAPAHWREVGLRQRVSYSQLARSSTSRPAACLETLLAGLLAQLPAQASAPLRRQVQLMDSTFLRLSALLSPWSQHGGHVAGIRLETGYDLAAAVPSYLRLTLADTPDVRALGARDLTPLAGWTLVIDQGYYGHQQFQRLQAHQVDFLCPLQPQAVYQVTASQPVTPAPTAAGDTILADETITLGSPRNYRGAVVPELRLITSQNPQGAIHRLVTSRHDLCAQDLVSLYRARWQIELFFRWLKHQLGVLHPLGTSRAAVWATILLAAIVAVLVALLRELQPASVTTVAWLRALSAHLTLIVRGFG